MSREESQEDSQKARKAGSLPVQDASSPDKRSKEYAGLIGGIAELLETARRASARTVNAFLTATYWEIGRRLVEFE